MDTELFITWMEQVFVANIGPERPVLLVIDNHRSLLAPDVVSVAHRNGIILFALPQHCTGDLQPLDVHFFSMMKSDMKSACVEARMCRENLCVKKEVIPALLAKILSRPKFVGFARDAFRRCGIFPFDPEPLLQQAQKQQDAR